MADEPPACGWCLCALPRYGWAEDIEGAQPKDVVTLGLRRHYNVRMPITYAVMLAGDGCK